MPIAITDCMNFGNPEKPEIMGQFVGAIKGIGEAVSAHEYYIWFVSTDWYASSIGA